MSRLKPVFDREFGQVTAGNSAQVTDGAACLILASGDAVQRHKLPILGRIVDVQWAPFDPREMGLGPVHAGTPLLQRYRLDLEHVDYWEINEAFAVQVLACLYLWRDKDYCRAVLGLDKAMGEIERERLNVDGGGISLGHPVGASGARIVLHLLHVLARRGGTRVSLPCVHRRRAGWRDAGGARGLVGAMTTQAFKHWRFEVDARNVAWLTLDKQDASTNVLSGDVLEELNRMLDEISAAAPAGMVIVPAKANGFIAGANVSEFTELSDGAQAAALVAGGQSIFDRLEALSFPTVARIHGFCLGGGLELALACRYRIALDDPKTRLGLPEVLLGIHPGFGGTVRLTRLTGAPLALDLMLSGRTLDARQALRSGVVDRVVPLRQLALCEKGEGAR